MKIRKCILFFFLISIVAPGFSQGPTRPKYIENKDLKSRYINKRVKLHLQGRQCDTSFLRIDNFLFKCLEDSIELNFNKEVHFFKLVIMPTIEGPDYHSMHLISLDSNNNRILRIYDSRILEIRADSIKINLWINSYDRNSGGIIKNECHNEQLWIYRKKLRGIYRPKF